MVAALRLLERGYRVTLYEEKNRVGGNLAGFEADGVRYDVYPHMFGDWYRNFWKVVENDLKLDRNDSDSASFQPRYMFKVLDRGAFPKYIDSAQRRARLGTLDESVLGIRVSGGDAPLGVFVSRRVVLFACRR